MIGFHKDNTEGEHMALAIKEWPLEERPREKLLARGAASLSDAELLAIFLRTGTNGVTAVDLARQLLDEFGGIRQLLEADEKTFCRHRGLGRAKYAQLKAILDILRANAVASKKATSLGERPQTTADRNIGILPS